MLDPSIDGLILTQLHESMNLDTTSIYNCPERTDSTPHILMFIVKGCVLIHIDHMYYSFSMSYLSEKLTVIIYIALLLSTCPIF